MVAIQENRLLTVCQLTVCERKSAKEHVRKNG